MLGAGTPTNLPAIVDRHYSPVALLDASTVTTYRLDSPVPIAVFRCYLQIFSINISSDPYPVRRTLRIAHVLVGSFLQASLHQWLHCMSNNLAVFFQYVVP